MFTYKALAERMFEVAKIDWNGREDMKETCRYGLELLIAFCVNSILLLFLGIMLKITDEIFIYILSWGSLRIFAGGKHEKNHIRCITAFIIVMMAVIITAKYITNNMNGFYVQVICLVTSLALHKLYSGRNKQSQEETEKNKKISIFILIGMISFVFYSHLFLKTPYMDYNMSVLAGAALAQSIYLIPESRKHEYDKDKKCYEKVSHWKRI